MTKPRPYVAPMEEPEVLDRRIIQSFMELPTPRQIEIGVAIGAVQPTTEDYKRKRESELRTMRAHRALRHARNTRKVGRLADLIGGAIIRRR